MSRSRRIAIGVLSIAWIVGIGLLTAWHQIWAPYLSWLARPKSGYTPLPEPKPIHGSFRYEFEERPDPYGSPVRLGHPVYGDLGPTMGWGGGGRGVGHLSAGALMMHTDPVTDCAAALNFGQEAGAEPEGAAVIALFARCQNGSQPYRTGYAYEWDMRQGRERIWAAGQLLAERSRPRDAELHTMVFVLEGDSLAGRIDGGAPLEASDNRFSSGQVGFGGCGDPQILCDWYELRRPDAGEARMAQPIDVGAPFALREPFRVSGPKAGESFAISTSDPYALPERDYGPYWPWYTYSRSSRGQVLLLHDPADSALGDAVVFLGSALCLITSKGAASSTLRAGQAGPLIDLYPRADFDYAAAGTRPGASLLVRVQEPDQAWAGCYSLTYNCQEHTIALVRYDKAGPPDPAHWLEPFPVRSTVLDSSRLGGQATDAVIWIWAEGATIRGGIGDATLVSAVDATYPSGYVGYGAPAGMYGTFRWVEMKGQPG